MLPRSRALARTMSAVLVCALLSVSSATGADEKSDQSEEVMAALQDIQSIVGEWQGSGKSEGSKGWDEKIHCSWKFNKNGRVSLYMTFADKADQEEGRLLEEAMITYDPAKQEYLFRAYKANDPDNEVITFEGKKASAGSLVLDRVEKGNAKDNLDRLDIKLLNDGDRIVYAFQRRVGQSKVYRSYSQVALDRQGTSLAGSAAAGPKCIITGGAGTIQVTYKGKSYPVCCTGCRETFLADPEKFIAKLEKAQK